MPDPSPDPETMSYAERLRSKGIQIGAGVKTTKKGKPGDNARFNQWEKGTAGEDRPGGTRMPYLDKDGATIGVKRFAEMGIDRSSIERRRHAAQNPGD